MTRTKRPKYGCWSEQTDINMVIGQTKKWELARQSRSKYGYWADRSMGIPGIKRIETWVQNKQTDYGYYPDRSDINRKDRNMGIGQTAIGVFVYLAD